MKRIVRCDACLLEQEKLEEGVECKVGDTVLIVCDRCECITTAEVIK